LIHIPDLAVSGAHIARRPPGLVTRVSRFAAKWAPRVSPMRKLELAWAACIAHFADSPIRG